MTEQEPAPCRDVEKLSCGCCADVEQLGCDLRAGHDGPHVDDWSKVPNVGIRFTWERTGHRCRKMETRHCPPSYGGPCPDLCARFESDDPAPWGA